MLFVQLGHKKKHSIPVCERRPLFFYIPPFSFPSSFCQELWKGLEWGQRTTPCSAWVFWGLSYHHIQESPVGWHAGQEDTAMCLQHWGATTTQIPQYMVDSVSISLWQELQHRHSALLPRVVSPTFKLLSLTDC